MLALGSPGCSVIRLFVRHHAENGPIQRKMVVECPLVITTKVKLFFRPDKTRNKELMVQPVFCIVDARSCYCWVQWYPLKGRLLPFKSKILLQKTFIMGTQFGRNSLKWLSPALRFPPLPSSCLNELDGYYCCLDAIATTACPTCHPPSKQSAWKVALGRGTWWQALLIFEPKTFARKKKLNLALLHCWNHISL